MTVKQNDAMYRAWNYIGAHEASLRAVTFDEQAEQMSHIEVAEVMQYLPDYQDKIVLDLAAGIGRFTQEFAKRARAVTAVDFCQGFHDRNQEQTRSYGNVECFCCDVVEWEYPRERYDLVFCNWLMMFLDDCHLDQTLSRIVGSAKTGGKIFFRESCNTSTRGRFDNSENYPLQPVREVLANTRYRTSQYYESLFEQFGLTLLDRGYIKLFEERFENLNQRYWLLEK